MAFREAVTLATTVAVAWLVAPAPPAVASGGGGCGGPVTDGRGTKVAIERFCFSPTVLYARPGDAVTWANRDSVPHNVGGANLAWGSFEQLRPGRSTSYSFSRPGVYAYVCSLHPGMVGTVVVAEPGPGATASEKTLSVGAAGATRAAPVPDAGALGDVGPVATAAILAALAGLVIGAGVGRRTRS
jgi:plastocyanin